VTERAIRELFARVAVLDVVAPWPLKYIVDNVIGGRPLSDPVGQWAAATLGGDPRLLTAAFGLTIILLAALGGLFSFVYEVARGTIQERTTFRLRSHAFATSRTSRCSSTTAAARAGDQPRHRRRRRVMDLVALPPAGGRQRAEVRIRRGGGDLFVNWPSR
jgi:hypothetical protein